MMRTLKDHLAAGGEWPIELEPIDNNGFPMARCTCGRRAGLTDFYDVRPPEVPVAERIPGRVRRARVKRTVGPAEARAREPEASPRWPCGKCWGAIVGLSGLSHEEIRDKVGHR